MTVQRSTDIYSTDDVLCLIDAETMVDARVILGQVEYIREYGRRGEWNERRPYDCKREWAKRCMQGISQVRSNGRYSSTEHRMRKMLRFLSFPSTVEKLKREINDEMGETNFIYGKNVKLAEI